MTKQQFYDFAMLTKEDSNLLFENNKLHNSTYLGGYVLEAYIKIILIHYDNPDFKNHLGSYNLSKKLQELFSLYPELFDNSILIQNNQHYPKNLFNGGGNNSTKASWKSNFRYDINKWSDSSFCEKVQKELEIIEEELSKLKLDGVI